MPSRVLKELRTLLPPSGLVLAAIAVAVAWSFAPGRLLPQLAESIAHSTFILGTPLVAAWALGVEFQRRTLVLLLTQPMSRTRVFLEKWVTMAAVAAALLAVQFAALDSNRHFEEEFPARVRLLLAAATVASAPLFTMIARSTIGGLALSGAALAQLELAASFVAYWFAGPGAPRQMLADTPALNAMRVLYAGLALATGWWWFSRLQVPSMDADASANARSFPLLRYRPRGWLANLLITEFQIHRPTWLLAAGFGVCWLATAAFASSGVLERGVIELTFTLVAAFYFPLALVLSGTLSVSEDRALGIHGWRLTWPVSARAQWATKLAASFTVAGIVLVIIPAGLVPLAAGSAPWARSDGIPSHVLATAAALVLVCFWASTVFGDAVRAAVASGALLLGLGVAAATASRMSYAILWLDGPMTAAMVRWQLPPDYFARTLSAPNERVLVTVLAVLAGAVAAALSYRAFRQLGVGRRTVATHVTTLVGLVFLGVLALFTYGDAAIRLVRSGPALELRELVTRAVRAKPPGPGETMTLDPETLRPGGATGEWLAGSRIAVTRAGHSSQRRAEAYEARVTFAGGREYRFLIYSDTRAEVASLTYH